MAILGVPEVLKRAWGDEVVEVFVPWLEEVLQEKVVSRDEYREILSRLDRVETRLDGVEREISEVKGEVREVRRVVDERFDRLRQDVDERLDRLYERMLVQNRWLVGSIALFGTVVSLLLAIGQFVK